MKRALPLFLAATLAGALYVERRPRASDLPLVTSVDGPAPAAAAGVVVYLHGRGGSIGRVAPIVRQLRQAGLPPDVAIVRVLLAHGSRDQRCPVEESRSLARGLEAAHKPVTYIEFDDGHVVPPEVVRALVALATAP